MFQHQIENGGGFECFHYRHRPLKYKGNDASTTHCMALVKLSSTSFTQFLSDYNGMTWGSAVLQSQSSLQISDDDYYASICIEPLPSSSSFLNAPELQPPEVRLLPLPFLLFISLHLGILSIELSLVYNPILSPLLLLIFKYGN